MHEVEGGEVQRDDADDPMRTFVRQVMGAVGELERRMTIKRLHDKRRTKASRGGYVGGPFTRRYGYRLVDRGDGQREWEPDPAEQQVISRIRALRDEGATLQAIADQLTAERVPTAKGGLWYPSTVRKLLEAGIVRPGGRNKIMSA